MAQRFDRLKVVVERSALDKHRARIGRRETVLVEGPSKRDDSVLSGRTEQHKLIHFPQPDVPVVAGSYVVVDVSDAAPHFLRGSYRETLAPPRHRRRLPVAAV